MKIMASQKFKEETLNRIINRGKIDYSSVSSSVREIIEAVRKEGDKAVLRYTEKFDNTSLTQQRLRVVKNEVKKAYKKLKRSQIIALKKAAINIARFHEEQIEDVWSLNVMKGVTLGQVT
ncbi:MAG: histidinol dehydrogenase, partial [Candidatus Bathyarchaeota archaeon]